MWTRFSAIILIIGLAAPVTLPVITIFVIANGTGDFALTQKALTSNLFTSFALMAVSACGAAIIGLTTALLVTVYHLPGKRLLDILLVLPLAIPAYVVAFAYTELFDQNSVVIAKIFSLISPQQPASTVGPTGLSIRNFWGACFVFAITLYPYVYLFTRAAIISRLGNLIDAVRLFPLPIWRKVKLLLPLLNSAVVTGCALVMMEVLTDYGLAEYFAIRTLAKSMFDIWFNIFDAVNAARHALVMVCIAIVLLTIERFARPARQSTIFKQPPTITISSWQKLILTGLILLPVIAGFLLPIGYLLSLTISTTSTQDWAELLLVAWQSINIAVIIALFTIAAGFAVNYLASSVKPATKKVILAILSSGYAVPGIIFAMGTLTAFSTFDRYLINLASKVTWLPEQLFPIFTGGLLILVFACIGRYFVIGINAAEMGSSNIPANLTYATQLLATNITRLQRWKLFWPMQRPIISAAFILIVIDYLKELPISLILRPFGVNTLAVKVFEHAKNEQVTAAAPLAITMAGLGVLAILVLCLRSGYHDPLGIIPRQQNDNSVKLPRVAKWFRTGN